MSESICLTPRPQRVAWPKGVLSLAEEKLIVLEGDDREALLRIGAVVQEALESVGGAWNLTTVRGRDAGQVGAVVRVAPGQARGAQGYRLNIGPDGIWITATDAAGAFYGAQTLRQIAAAQRNQAALPYVRIEDWPDFEHRGVMLDVSRDRVPTMETLYEIVDTLAGLKCNELQLYTEHTFAYRRHRTVWAEASPLTGEEILALDGYCRENFIELTPNQNCFGHMARWLKHPQYNHLAEAPEGCEIPGRHLDPFSLCPTDPGALALVEEMLTELLGHFTSGQCNVGCDETFDLGRGRSQELCERRGVGRVYLDFLLQIEQLVRSQGRVMQFWGDIILEHPELIPELPKDVVALEWGYEAEHPFDGNCAQFAAAGIPFYVCPGTSAWNTLAGRTDNALGNLRSAAVNGRKHGAVGYLITDWGDGGHHQPLPVSYLGYTYGLAVSWATEANLDLDVAAALDAHIFLDAAGAMGKVAYDLGNAYQVAGSVRPNCSLVARMLREAALPAGKDVPPLTVDGLEQTIAHIDAALARLDAARMERPDAELVRAEFAWAGGLLQHACRLGLALLAADQGDITKIAPERRTDLAAELAPLIEEHQRLWRARSREGGLVDSVAHLRKLQSRYQGQA